MTRKIIIKFDSVRTDDLDLVSRVHDFGEDLCFALRDNEQGDLPLEEADSADALIGMTVRTVPRFVGEVTQLIKKLLKKHRLQDITEIVRE